MLFDSPAMAENMQPTGSDPRCAVCRDIWQRDMEAEVYYRKCGTKKKLAAEVPLIVCMDCILSDRWLHANTSGQVKAFKMLRECALQRCDGNQSDPMWFCYDCFKYICNECKQNAEHTCDGKKVGNILYIII